MRSLCRRFRTHDTPEFYFTPFHFRYMVPQLVLAFPLEEFFFIGACMLDSSSEKIRVVLVDDHPTVRQTLRSTLQSYPNIEVVGEASDGEEALARVEHLQPAVVVMDIYMGRMDGVTATRLIKAQYPEVAVIGLTIAQKDFQLYAMHTAGAIEVIGKENMAEVPGAILRAVA